MNKIFCSQTLFVLFETIFVCGHSFFHLEHLIFPRQQEQEQSLFLGPLSGARGKKKASTKLQLCTVEFFFY